MKIRLEIEQDWDAADDPEEFIEEFDSYEEAEKCFDYYAGHYAWGKIDLHISGVTYEEDGESINLEFGDVFSEFKFSDAIEACRETLGKDDWVTLTDYLNAKRVPEPEVDAEPALRRPEMFTQEELVEMGYDDVVVYENERWIKDADNGDGTADIHRIEGESYITVLNVKDDQLQKPLDEKEVKQYIEDSASTFCGDTCSKCGTRIRLVNTTKRFPKATTMQRVNGADISEALHQDEGEITWFWTCPECGADGTIHETFHMLDLEQKFYVGDHVLFDDREWIIEEVAKKAGRYILIPADTESRNRRFGIEWKDMRLA